MKVMQMKTERFSMLKGVAAKNTGLALPAGGAAESHEERLKNRQHRHL